MQLLFINDSLQGVFFQAFAWTLLHSLWQGVVLAGLAAIVILLTRRSPAQLRYNVLGILLLLFIVATLLTFCNQFASIQSMEETTGRVLTDVRTTIVPVSFSFHEFQNWFDAYAGYFLLAWTLIFIIHCLRLLAGLNHIDRLRTRQTQPGKHYWQQELSILAHRLGITTPVGLFESPFVKVPVVVGVLKPVILLPAGLLLQLPADQVETILLHELAHIRRKDYLVNLLQRLTEAVFFFNPGLCWVSSRLREEREGCCDDIVVANTHHQTSYLEALVSFEEFASGAPAMAIVRKKNHLLSRVKRMLTRENKKLNAMEKLVLLTAIAGLTAFAFMPQDAPAQSAPPAATAPASPTADLTSTPLAASVRSRRERPQAPAAPASVSPALEPSPVEPASDTTPKTKAAEKPRQFPFISRNITVDGDSRKEITIAKHNDGKSYTFTMEDRKVTGVEVDGKKVPENEIENYSSLLGEINNEGRAREASVPHRQEWQLRKEAHQRKVLNWKRERALALTEKKRLSLDNDRKLQEKRSLFKAEDMKRRLQMKREQSDREQKLKSQKRLREIDQQLRIIEQKQRKDEQKVRSLKQKQREMEMEQRHQEKEWDIKKNEWEREEKNRKKTSSFDKPGLQEKTAMSVLASGKPRSAQLEKLNTASFASELKKQKPETVNAAVSGHYVAQLDVKGRVNAAKPVKPKEQPRSPAEAKAATPTHPVSIPL